ncbi:MAG: tRNA pseudouridine(38-40) synthase TruA [Sandaracinaceae bacterium]|nr:tRNA pseudouridine(38-40) synthase TruA [Sandaracinaceae bacterium]
MHGVRVVVAYDGAGFAGWQRQPGQRTVQSELEAAVAALAGADVRVRGASRTDSGVHALGQLAAFDSPRAIPPYKWLRGLNGKLPPDVAVRSAEACEAGYEPRFDARAKTYRYLLHLGPARDPLLRDRAWHLGPKRARPTGGRPTRTSDWLDLDAMRGAAAELLGTHDFRAFRSAHDPREQTVRTLWRADVIAHFGGREDVLAIEVRGDAFLHNMMRIIAGTLVEVGRGRRTARDVAASLASGARADAGETAPPGGLYLVEIERRSET